MRFWESCVYWSLIPVGRLSRSAARPFAVNHMEAIQSYLWLPGWHNSRGDWKPSSIYQLYGSRSGPGRPGIIVAIYPQLLVEQQAKKGKQQRAIDWSDCQALFSILGLYLAKRPFFATWPSSGYWAGLLATEHLIDIASWPYYGYCDHIILATGNFTGYWLLGLLLGSWPFTGS